MLLDDGSTETRNRGRVRRERKVEEASAGQSFQRRSHKVEASIVNAAGQAYSLSSVSAMYGIGGQGAPGVVALAEGETTGTYTGVFTPSGAGTLVVTVKGFDSTPTLQAVAVCRVQLRRFHPHECFVCTGLRLQFDLRIRQWDLRGGTTRLPGAR